MILWTLALALAADPPTAPLAGCWQGGAEGLIAARETWLGPTAGLMAGVLLGTTADGKGTWEQMRIEPEGEGFVMVILPQGQAETRFVLTAHDATSWTFTNPDHDFPQRIHYRRDADALQVTADADDGKGGRRGFTLRYRRCDG